MHRKNATIKKQVKKDTLNTSNIYSITLANEKYQAISAHLKTFKKGEGESKLSREQTSEKKTRNLKKSRNVPTKLNTSQNWWSDEKLNIINMFFVCCRFCIGCCSHLSLRVSVCLSPIAFTRHSHVALEFDQGKQVLHMSLKDWSDINPPFFLHPSNL